MALNEKQQLAVDLAVNSKAKTVAVTGGPGTGKTFTMKTIMDELSRKYGATQATQATAVNEDGEPAAAGPGSTSAVLAAPTGRAAKRLNESTGYPASTIHRLLGPIRDPNNGSFTFRYGDAERLPARFIGLDESSMIDVPLAASVCRAAHRDARLILVGDIDQLPSVGPGTVLADVINSGVIPTVRLTEILRQAEGSMIIKNAHRINHGMLPTASEPGGDFMWFKTSEEDTIIERVQHLAQQITQETGQRPQIIVPQHRVKVGTKNLNRILQQLLNPNGANTIKYGKDDWAVLYKEGDWVMNTKNDYDKGLMNGDTGKIVKIELRKGAERSDDKTIIWVNFNIVAEEMTKEGDATGHYRDEQKLVEFQRAELAQLVHAWAMTIHKSQGCEWDDVIIPLHSSHNFMLQRNLLYTAVTRAKKRCWLIGSEEAVGRACRTTRAGDRQTMLCRMLKDEI